MKVRNIEERINLFSYGDTTGMQWDENKDQLIALLIKKNSENGHNAVPADGDADVLICKTAIDLACEGRNVMVVGEDVDLMHVSCLYAFNQRRYHIPEIWERNTAILFILNTQYLK